MTADKTGNFLTEGNFNDADGDALTVFAIQKGVEIAPSTPVNGDGITWAEIVPLNGGSGTLVRVKSNGDYEFFAGNLTEKDVGETTVAEVAVFATDGEATTVTTFRFIVNGEATNTPPVSDAIVDIAVN